MAFGALLLQDLARAFVALGRRVLVLDAGESAPEPHELAALDLAACVQPIDEQVGYLAARGLPLRHVDARGSCAGLLQAALAAAPQADVLLVHASAGELARLFTRQAVRPLLLASDHPASVTHAYGAMKLLHQRTGLATFDLLLEAAEHSPRRDAIADRVASCADRFLGAVLHDWAAIDPAAADDEPLPDALLRIARDQLAPSDDTFTMPVPAARLAAGPAAHRPQ
ncbi:flagellar biosynthesis protein [Aquabacterium sp. J223]|uniref:flagellar biosynthesis protein n=1 Tax=Aquabacterium sp. J223 TaxID=2898431 RepID=UPI0021AD61D2|nr:flagellar biosynthesis protein [Aquabacterium sp. J223]UUX94853.1 flagellar biosynthesis protein [Aquabacterium sp. J223]